MAMFLNLNAMRRVECSSTLEEARVKPKSEEEFLEAVCAVVTNMRDYTSVAYRNRAIVGAARVRELPMPESCESDWPIYQFISLQLQDTPACWAEMQLAYQRAYACYKRVLETGKVE